MLIQGSPTILSPMNSPMSVRTSAFSGLGGFGGANVNDAQIAAYVQSILSDASMTPQQQAANIAAAAQANGVSVGDISRATGYDASTVTSFLNQALAPSAPQPAPSPVSYSAPIDTIVNTTAFTPAPPAPPTADAINNYVQSVLNDNSLTLQQQAKEIAATAANNNVSVQQIAAATGYDVGTVTTFLAQAVPTASTAPTTPPPSTAKVTPAQTAPTTDQIKNFVQKTLSDPTMNDIQKATLIANTAIADNVTVNQIVAATGYNLATTLNYLSQAKIDTAAAANSVAYKSFTQAVADQAAAQHLVDQAAAVKAQQAAADAAKAAAKLVTDQASAKTKAEQDAALAQIQATVLAAQKKAAADAAALADAKVKAATTPTKTNVDLVAKLNTVASASSQTLQKTTEVLKTATNQVANNQTITVAPTATATGTGTNILPILIAAGAFFMGQ
jgi:DNA-binding MarR family transcriptional regulator